MNRGFPTATDAIFGYTTRTIIHSEINSIENSIMEVSNAGYREVVINNTLVTSDAVKSAKSVTSVNLGANTITVTAHGLTTGNSVEFTSTASLPDPLVLNTLYNVEVIDANTIKLYASILTTSEYLTLETIGSGDISVRQIIESEKYYMAWREFYLFPYAESYLGVLSEIERHFRDLGYNIKRVESTDSDTFYWKIQW